LFCFELLVGLVLFTCVSHLYKQPSCSNLVGVALDSLFVHIPKAFSWEEQVEILQSVKLGANVAPYRYGFDKLGVLMPDDGGGFDVLSHSLKRLWECAQRTCESVPTTEYDVHTIELLGYRAGSALHPHVDFVEGWSVIISLGATARFFFCVGDGEKKTLNLKSGDAIAFPTCGKTKVFHGIESFDDDKPSWFVLRDYARVCIQFRSTYYHLQLD
jgi:hypothetical protein